MWFGNIGEFMKAVSTIPEVPDSKSYIDAINEEGRSRSGTEGDGDRSELIPASSNAGTCRAARKLCR
jgi:hypothetical protein